MQTPSTRALSLVVVQPTSLCNLDCSYCYVPDRLERRLFPLPLLERLFRLICASSAARDQPELNILWHAGEPLAAGLDYFKEAFDVIARISAPRWRLRHSVQTNGTLITDEWCRFFRMHQVAVGVSIDGPARIHDANRKTRGGKGSFARGMLGVERCRAHGIPISVLSVLTSVNIDQPDEMFHFFVDGGFKRVAFNVDEIEGPHIQSSLATTSIADARTRYGAFMRRMAALNRLEGTPLEIREFTRVREMIRRRRVDPAYQPYLPEQDVGAILTITRDGQIFTSSPELASLPPDQAAEFSLGNVRDVESLDDLFAGERAASLQAQIDEGVAMCRATCSYFGVCGGGSPGNKLYERGTFAATETLKCVLQAQELTEAVLDAIMTPIS